MSIPIHYIAIGSELLSGKIREANGHWLSQYLTNQQVELSQITILPDDEKSLSDFFTAQKSKKQLLVISGGLGPTKDDKTKALLASLFNSPLVESNEAFTLAKYHYDRIEKDFDSQKSGYHLIPQNWQPLSNPKGLAPGLFYQSEELSLLVLPGVPLEFKMMIEEHLKHYYSFESIEKIDHASVRILGVSEEALFFKRAPSLWNELESMGQVSCLPANGYLDIGITGKNINKAKFYQVIEESLPNTLIYKQPLQIHEYLMQYLKDQKLTITTAESCTGGLCSHLLTQLAGSSSVIRGSIVAYQKQIKQSLLNVDAQTINDHSVYSHQVAREMAIGARSILNTDIAISTTGIAGPDGDVEGNPVGSLYVGIDVQGEVSSFSRRFNGDREQLKLEFSKWAFLCLLKTLKNIS